MVQPALDLPDPINSPDSLPQNGADDLLTQLAGDQINRMLSDSDAQPRDGSDTVPPPVVVTVAEQLNSFFDEIEKGPPPAPEPSVLPALEDEVEENLVTRHEYFELTAPHSEMVDLIPINAELDESDRSNSAFVRMLEWLNAPLKAMPNWVRTLVGVLGIVLMLGAISVIGYVVILRVSVVSP